MEIKYPKYKCNKCLRPFIDGNMATFELKSYKPVNPNPNTVYVVSGLSGEAKPIYLHLCPECYIDLMKEE